MGILNHERIDKTLQNWRTLNKELQEQEIERKVYEDHLWRVLKLSNHKKIEAPPTGLRTLIFGRLCPLCAEKLEKDKVMLALPSPNGFAEVWYFQCTSPACEYEFVRRIKNL